MVRVQATAGCLYVAASPIGNVEDITLRAIRILSTVSVIGCENVARTKSLLQTLQIETKDKNFIVLNDVNEVRATAQILTKLASNLDVVIVSDRGTPLISDPGFQLVREARKANILIVPLPGPSAPATLASICPIPLSEYRFIGFIAKKGTKRRVQLMELKTATTPTIVFESPHRIVQTLKELVVLGMGATSVFLGREMTKRFEEYIHTTVQSLYDELLNRPRIKGEIVLVFDRGEPSTVVWSSDQLARVLLPYLKPTQLATVIAQLTDLSRPESYSAIVDQSDHPEQT